MSCYKHFTTKERESLLVLLKKGQKNSEIAKELGRSPSSISGEIRRNAATREEYSAIRAEEQYRERRKRCVRHYKLSEPDYARKVSELLVAYWSPEEISGRLKLEGNAIRISHLHDIPGTGKRITESGSAEKAQDQGQNPVRRT